MFHSVRRVPIHDEDREAWRRAEWDGCASPQHSALGGLIAYFLVGTVLALAPGAALFALLNWLA